MILCSVGIMAYNEAANIGALLDCLCAQNLGEAAITEIIVVASGCQDGTEVIVREKMALDPRIRLITEKQRNGKASAINLFIKESHEEILVLQSADTLADSDAIERLVTPFMRKDIGMVGARPIPLNDTDRFCGYAIHFIWRLHHLIALKQAKCGEMTAFRKTFDALPHETVVDEPMIEALTHEAGLKIAYQPTAHVYNMGPNTIREIFSRRKSIVTGYLLMKRFTPYRVATMGRKIVAHMLIQTLTNRNERFFWAMGAIALELAARCSARADYFFHPGRPYHLWDPACSTKNLGGSSAPKKEVRVD